ncbi:alkaline phosphatase [Spongiibacter marinus]|uniref:alkaline phosphatase n=1 Tax=Spongiibacter marinus TaxID=354246 RepID=UPI003C4975C2
MRLYLRFGLLLGVIAGVGCSKTPPPLHLSSPLLENTLTNPWYQQAQRQLLDKTTYAQAHGKAKNIILFVGDGMGVSTITAARILDGQQKGMPGEENNLSFDRFPFSGLIKTYNVDAQTPDSAGTMTAIVSGVKTNIGLLGVDENTRRGDCSSATGKALVSLLELAEIAGKATGLVSTARVTHATPAATYAKSADRNWEDNSTLPQQAISAGCEDIASQLISFEKNLEARFANVDVDGIDVVMGGGRRHFLPASIDGGQRTDGRNLLAEWQQQYPAARYLDSKAALNALDLAATEKLFALFSGSHMQYELERRDEPDNEPSLREMTEAALALLSKNEQGFFLMVEAGRIDHGHHAGNASKALHDTIALSEAVALVVEQTSPEDTLIVVTADHSHIFTIAGYPRRGNPILGKVVSVGSSTPSTAADGLPYTTLAYANGPGSEYFSAQEQTAAGSRRDLHGVDTQAREFQQDALVPLSSETHGGEDVAVYAIGPGAALLSGTNEQNFLFHVMAYASGLLPQPAYVE